MMTTSEAAKLMGCTVVAVDNLLKAGVLGYLANDGLVERIYRFVGRAEIDAFINELAAKVQEVASVDDSEMRLISASNYKMTTAVPHIISGKIRAYVLREDPVRLDTIYLNIVDMQREKRADPQRSRLMKFVFIWM